MQRRFTVRVGGNGSYTGWAVNSSTTSTLLRATFFPSACLHEDDKYVNCEEENMLRKNYSWGFPARFAGFQLE
jgi:hypothetical protein